MITIIAKKNKTNLHNIIELLAEIKRTMRNDDVVKEICKEHGFDIDILDGIPIEFIEDLEASAKTTNSCIKLNSNLLDEEFEVIMRYAVHELVHALQHMLPDNYNCDDEEYLERPDELSAFQYQIKYEDKERGKDKAEEYVDDLIEYHEIPPEKQENKKEELLEKTD